MDGIGLLAELEVLLFEGLSISEISRRLADRGYDVHRLILTGYLRALTDTGILVEEDVPPAKVYRYAPSRYDDVYQLVGKVLEGYQGTLRLDVAVALLTRLFHRPVFREELRRVGVTEFSSPAMVTAPRERVRPLGRLRRSLSIPQDDPAFEFDAASRRQVEPQVIDALLAALRESLDLGALVSQLEQKTLPSS